MCTGDSCSGSVVIVIIILVAIFLLASLFTCIKAYIRNRLSKPKQSNSVFITHGTIYETESKKQPAMFQSGTWLSSYFQYGRWHTEQKLTLEFNSILSNVTGEGVDDVGRYKVSGCYSAKTRRIGLEKQYLPNTGNFLENLGHKVIIQMTWNMKAQHFRGTWYVTTVKYSGNGMFRLRPMCDKVLALV